MMPAAADFTDMNNSSYYSATHRDTPIMGAHPCPRSLHGLSSSAMLNIYSKIISAKAGMNHQGTKTTYEAPIYKEIRSSSTCTIIKSL